MKQYNIKVGNLVKLKDSTKNNNDVGLVISFKDLSDRKTPSYMLSKAANAHLPPIRIETRYAVVRWMSAPDKDASVWPKELERANPTGEEK